MPLINTEYATAHVPSKILLGTLHPIPSEHIKVSNILWTKGNTNTADSPTELLNMPPESSFQPEQNNSKQLMLLQDIHIPQEAKYKLSSLLEGDYNSIVLKSCMNVRRTNHFQMDIPAVGPPIVCKPYPLKAHRLGNMVIGKWRMHM